MRRTLFLLLAVLLLGTAVTWAQTAPVTGISQVRTDKVYTISTSNRGAWYAPPGEQYMNSTTKKNVPVNPSSPAQQFAFVPHPAVSGSYLLYSVGEQKFLTLSGSFVELTSVPDATAPVTLSATTNNDFPTVVTLNGNTHVGISNRKTYAIFAYQSLTDGGNQAKIVAVGDFDAAAQQAAATAAAQQANLFQASADYESATWYYLRNGNDNARFAHYDAANPTYVPLSTARSNEDRYKWAFIGTTMGGYKLINKATGATKFLYAGTANNGTQNTLSNQATVYEFVFGKPGKFGLRSNGKYLNDYSNQGKLSFWQDGPKADNGSNWSVQLAEGSFLISMATGALTRNGAPNNAWNNLWTATGTMAFTLQASANNMARINGQTAIDLRSGRTQSSLYTLSAPLGYLISGYTVQGQARTANAQTLTPSGQSTGVVFNNSAQSSHLISLAQPARQAQFTLTGANTGLAATIRVHYVPVTAPEVADPVQGHQTAGRGTEAVLMRATLNSPAEVTALTGISLALPDGTDTRLSAVKAYLTPASDQEFHATARTPIATGTPAATLTLTPTAGTQLAAGTVYNLWITATPSADAPLGSTIDAALTGLAYSNASNGSSTIALNLNPTGTAKVFQQQQFLFVPTSNNCRYYRIPAMIVAKDNSLVAVTDMRYNSESDLGNHDIDLAVRRSVDGGANWSAPHIFANGDGTSENRYGFGDAALAVAPSGKLICLMAAGRKSFGAGITHIFMSTSDNHGQTWTTPTEITLPGILTDEVTGTPGGGMASFFVTSGRGITTTDGTVMFLIDAKVQSTNSPEQSYVIYSRDEGQTWTIGRELVYNNANEGKLVQRADGSLLASVRQNGARGFNVGSSNGTRWVGQYTASTLNDHNCNADILAYSPNLMLHTLVHVTNPRADLRIYASRDHGVTWTEVYQVQAGRAAYSTMAKLPNGDLAILYEDLSYNSGNGFAINYVTIPAATVSAWETTSAPLNYADRVTANLAPWFTTNVGNYFGLKEDVRDAYSTELADRQISSTLDQYFDLLDVVRAGVRYPETGYYRLKNVQYPLRRMQYGVPVDNSLLAASPENTGTTAVNTIVKLERNTNNTYALKMQDQYLQAPTQSANVPLGTTPKAFLALTPAPGKVAFQGNASDAYSLLHASVNQSFRIVGWVVTAPASQWEVEDLAQVDLADATPYVFADEAPVQSIHYTRIFKNTAWQALYLPFAVPYEAWNGTFEMAEITGMKQTDEDNNGLYETLHLRGRFLRSGQTEPNRAYFIRYTGGEASSTQPAQATLTVTQSLLTPSQSTSVAHTSGSYELALKGTYQTITDMSTQGYWALSNGRLVRTTNAAATLSPYRWYMTLNSVGGQTVPVKDLRMSFSMLDEETGIEHTQQVETAEAETAYDLQGRRIGQPKQPGLYIITGKKIIKK